MFVTRHSRLAGAALFILAAACSRPDAKGVSERGAAGFRGVVIAPPRAKPDFALPDQNGRIYDFRKETEGKVALLFFGYTHCPDVCPLHVANVAAVLKRLSFEDREAVRFIFVTTDPKRDTPARLKEWLANFDPSFVGLRAPEGEVNRLLAELQMPPIETDPTPTDSVTYLVGHAAQVIAFGKDGLGRVEYPFGVRQEDWRHDLPLLARGVVPETNGAEGGGGAAAGIQGIAESAAARAAAGRSIQVSSAIIPAPATTSEGALYLVLRNDAARDDTLLAVWTDYARRAEVHETMAAQNGVGMSHMSAVPSVVVGAGSTVTMAPGGQHVMLLQLARALTAGERIPVRLRFANAGDVEISAEVVSYADVEKRLAPIK